MTLHSHAGPRGGGGGNRLGLLRALVTGGEPAGCGPVAAYVESTSRCNLDCPMCARQLAGPGWRDLDMPEELFARAVGALGPGCELVFPFGGGEPLLRPDIGRLVALCRASGRATELATNATLLDGRAARDLVEAGLDALVVSLDAATPETYSRIRRGASYERTCRNVMTFLRWKRRLGARTRVVVQMIALPENRSEAALFRRQWSGLEGVDSVRVKADEVRVGGSGPAARPRHGQPGRCHFPWIGPALVRYDGAVFPCCHGWRGEPFGDIRRETLPEIWNGPAMAALRRAHLEGEGARHPTCRDCQALRPRLELVAASLVLTPALSRRLVPRLEAANRLLGGRLLGS